MAGNARRARREMCRKAVRVGDGKCLWKDSRQLRCVVKLSVFKLSVWP